MIHFAKLALSIGCVYVREIIQGAFRLLAQISSHMYTIVMDSRYVSILQNV